MKDGNAKGRATTIVLPERVDSATSAGIERTIIEALKPRAQVIIDGHAVGYMSAAGVRTLATVLHRAEELRVDVVFCRFTGAAADCLLVSGFSQLFDVAESAEEAHGRLQTKETQPPVERLHPRRTTG